jgi:copper(I)-binding protein
MHAVRELAVPAHATHSFRSGGDHIMLVDLTRPLRAETRFRVVLTRRGAPALRAIVTVRGP